MDDEVPSIDHDRGSRRGADDLDYWSGVGVDDDRTHVVRIQLLAGLVDPLFFVFFHAEGLDHPDAGDGLDHEGAQFAETDLTVTDGFFVPQAEDMDEEQGRGNDDQGDQ